MPAFSMSWLFCPLAPVAERHGGRTDRGPSKPGLGTEAPVPLLIISSPGVALMALCENPDRHRGLLNPRGSSAGGVH